MKQIVALKLEPRAVQYQELLATMHAFNQACQHIADIAFEHRTANKIALQPLVYNELRSRFGLSSQMVVRAISKACEAYKPDKDTRPLFALDDAMIFDQRILSIKGLTFASVLTLSGRHLIPFRFLRYRAARSNQVIGQAELLLIDSVFYLDVCIDLPSAPLEADADGKETSPAAPHPGLLPQPRNY